MPLSLPPALRRKDPEILALIDKIHIVADEAALEDFLAALAKPDTGRPVTVAFLNAHAFNMCHRDPAFLSDLMACDYVLRDGIGIKILFKLMGRDPGLNMNGKWYSDEFGEMMIIQDKNGFRGTYEDPRGPDHNGRFQGAIQGDLLTLEWVKPGNPVAAIMPVRGKGYLRIIQSGKRLEGRWGYDDSIDDGGKWTAEKSQFQ